MRWFDGFIFYLLRFDGWKNDWRVLKKLFMWFCIIALLGLFWNLVYIMYYNLLIKLLIYYILDLNWNI